MGIFSRNKDRIDELESRVEELEEENQSLKQRYEAESNRRSELARKKQDVDKQLKKTRQKLENLQNQTEKEEESDTVDFEEIEALEGISLLRKLGTIRSQDDDLLTVKLKDGLKSLEDGSGLKNTMNSRYYSMLVRESDAIMFTDGRAISVVLRCRPFFEPGWKLDNCFVTEELLEFYREEKTWVAISAGKSLIIKEKAGEILDVRKVSSRVDRDHSQGGYSQSRFEKKREKQVKEHIELLQDKLEVETPILLGEKRMCNRLEGHYMGGFDDNRELLDELYRFRFASPF